MVLSRTREAVRCTGIDAVGRLTEMRQMKLLIVGDEPHSRSDTLHEPQTAQESSGMGASAFKLLVGEREHRLYPMNPETIDYIESDGNYVTIRSGSAKYISRDSIKRSLLVNIRAVAYVEAVGRGMFAFTLTSGAVLHSSTSYRDSILRILPMRRLSIRRT